MKWKNPAAQRSPRRRGGVISACAVLVAVGFSLAGCGDVNIETSGHKELKSRLKSEITSELLRELTGGQPGMTTPVASSSACVSCHTDKEKLKMETARIKAPPKSAMTSGKG